jgi:putative membrane protein
MIDYDPKAWWRILLTVRGSVLPALVPRLLLVTAASVAAVLLHRAEGVRLPPLAHTLVGVALGLLLVFRTNSSYDRWWEGRRLLGALTNRCRDLARQASAFLAEDDRREIARLIHVMMVLVSQHLRRERELAALGELVTSDERARLEPWACRPALAAAWIGARLAASARAGRLSEQRLQLMDANVTAFVDAWGGAERILKTPVPFAYAQHIKSLLVLFCLTAPFAMADAMGWATPAAAALLAFGLFGIDEIGVEIEDPFGRDANDLPVDAVVETIARDTAALAGATIAE